MNSRSLKIVLLVAFLIILLGILSVFKDKEKVTPDLSNIGTPEINIDNTIKEKELLTQNENKSTITTEANSVLNNEAISYSDFIKLYGDKRIQFDEECRATPSSASFTVGDFIILDNRSDKIQAVRFIDDLYALPPLHVRVFELKRQGIFDIDCGTLKNVAKITVH